MLCAAHAPGGGALLTAGEGGFLSAWDQSSGKEVLSVPKAHAVRIRGVAVPWAAGEDGSGGAGPSELPRLVATASTDGEVKLWDLRNTVRGGPERHGRLSAASFPFPSRRRRVGRQHRSG